MVRRNECPQISEVKNKEDSWGQGRILVQDLGLPWKEVKAFKRGSTSFAKCHASLFCDLSEHCGHCSFADAAGNLHKIAP